jgi:chitodextrinase
MSRNAGQARAWIHRGSVRYVVLPVSSPKTFTALRVASTPNTHVIRLIKLPTLAVRTSLPAPVVAATSSLRPSGGGGGSGGGKKRPDNKPPSVPGGLVVSSAGQTNVALTWRPSTDNVGVVGYGVYSNGRLVASSTSTSYTLAGLTCGTSDSLAVDAYDAAGNRSSRATVTTSTAACPVTQSGTQPPTAPTGIALDTRTTTSISITWTASTDNVGVAGYDLYAGSSEVGTATAAAAAYTFTGLTCGTSYTLGVDAFDAAGNHSPETTGVFSTSACPDTTPPSTPTGLVVSSAGQTSVALNWNASTDNVGVVGYGVYSNGKLVASPTSTGYTLTGLTCGTSYSVAVDAYDAAGNRSSLATVTTSTVACPDNQRPTAPMGIALGTRTTTSISITWTASTDNVGVVGYDLFADPFAGSTNVGTATATAYTFTGLTCGSSYTLGVDAYDAAGNHSLETTAVLSTSACPPDTAPPSTPTGLATSGVGQTGATLSWTASGDNVGVTGYRLYQGSTQVGNSATTSYAFTTLSCGTSYTFGVAAVDAAGNVSGTATISAATAPCSASSQFSGTFDCFGSTPNCTGLSPASCTQTITSGLQAALNSALGGAVICLNSATSFGNISLTGKSYSSTVTVQPSSGVAAKIGAVTLNGVSRLRITGVGAASLSPTSLTVGGTIVDNSDSGCSSNLAFDHLIFNAGTGQDAYFRGGQACSHGLNITWDHDRFDISPPGSCERCRFWVEHGASGSSLALGVTLSNSLISGGCADGIALDGAGSGPVGVVIGPGNEFTNLSQSYSNANCGGSHIDAIGGFGSVNTVVTGNYFHDNGGASGSVLSDIEPGLVFTNNVVTGSMFYVFLVKGPNTNTITHNYLESYVDWNEISNEGTWGGGNLLRNNVFTGSCLSVGATTYTADHNLGSGTGCDTAGSPVFVSSPASGYYHYQLASTSPGYHAASDGKSMGIAP